MSSRFVLFLLAFTVALIVTAPATLLASAVVALSEGRLALANCKGTVWRGEATPLLQLSDGTALPLSAIRWKMQFSALLGGDFRVDLSWSGMPEEPPMEILLLGNRVVVKNALILLPARVIGEASHFLKPAQFNGQLKIHSDRLEFSNRQLDGKATVHWSQAGSALSSINPLGDYRIDLESRQNTVQLALTTLAGALQLEGKGDWTAAQGIRFEGYARAGGEQHERLSELLHHIGPEVMPGQHAISISAAR